MYCMYPAVNRLVLEEFGGFPICPTERIFIKNDHDAVVSGKVEL